jgi:hypothetical protein
MKVRAACYLAIGTATVLVAVLAVPAPVYSHKPITTNILFKNEIAQIFQRKCFQCHSENNLSMSLTTYTEARPWARAIREEVLEREMPPWQAVPGYGHFANDLSLNSREKEIILSWADGGAPSGVLKDEESIPPVYVPDAPEWAHGDPDKVYSVGAGHTVAAGAPLEIKRFVVSTDLAAPKRVHAIALKQGDRRVVRHAAFYDAASGRWLGGWTPWQTVSKFVGNVAVLLPAKARIAVEIGYVGADVDVIDTSELGLYFDDAAPAVAEALTWALGKQAVPAGAEAHRVRVETKVPKATKAVALWVDFPPEASSVEIASISPDGVSTPLLWIQDYKPEWRTPYFFDAPVALAAGSRLVLTTYFDNLSDNPLAAAGQAWVLHAPALR